MSLRFICSTLSVKPAFVTSASLMLVLSACNSNDFSQSTLTKDGPINSPASASSPAHTAGKVDTPTAEQTLDKTPMTAIGPNCHTNDNQVLCLGLKYVVYQNSKGKPSASKETAIKNIGVINQLWSQCQITFEIDDYLSVEPTQYGLNYNTAEESELNDIRKTFDDNSHLLVVTTGTWNRNGSLGNSAANAWTSMPGESLYGAILEKPVGDFGNIIAHELGHYLNLDHADDSSNLMNPVIYGSSDQLTSDQCSTAKSAIRSYWQASLR